MECLNIQNERIVNQEKVVTAIQNKILKYKGRQQNIIEKIILSWRSLVNVSVIIALMVVTEALMSGIDFFFGMGLLFSILIALKVNERLVHNKRVLEGLNVAVPYLEDVLFDEQEKLEVLKKEEMSALEFQEESKNECVVGSKEIMDMLEKESNFYECCGYNRGPYLRFYKEGDLYSELVELGYSEEEMNKIESYIAHEAFYEEEKKAYKRSRLLKKK